MSNTNSRRITQDLERDNNAFRQDDLQSILTDLDQDANNIGYEEIIRDGNGFVTDIIIWTDSGKTTKLLEFNVVRTSFPFIDSVTKKIYLEDGITVSSTVTSTVSRNANKTINHVDTSNVRS